MLKLSIKNWKKYQHFRDRRPPWIKLYRDILDDIEWHQLDPLSAKVLVMLWLIASENEGNLPPIKVLAFRLRMFEKQLESTVSKLSHWLIQDDIAAISPRYQDDPTETERETETYKQETKTELLSSPDDLLAAWNRICVSLPKGLRLTAKRIKHSKARLKEYPLSEWESIFAKIEGSEFCRGNGGTGWTASFDWIISSPDNAVKVLEGKYEPPKTVIYEKEKEREQSLCQTCYSKGIERKGTTRLGNARYCADHVMEAM